ncbi:MAG: hypothetical protein WC880_01645 [Candidatus Paceibacterota bacterium]
MKKIFLIILLLALAPMSVSAEEVIQATTIDTNPTLLSGLPNDINLSSSDTDTDSSKSAEVAGCKSDSQGSLGSISGILGSLFQGGNLSSLLRGAQSGNISGIISSITGGSQTGQIISSLLGSNGNISSILSSSGLGNVVGNLLGGGSGGGIGNTIGGLLGGGGGSISGLLGGGLGGIAGGALGLIGGGMGAVPVSDSTIQSNTQKIQGNTKQIQADQDTQLEVTCVQNVLVRKTRIDATQHLAAENARQITTGRDGGTFFEKRPLAEIINTTNDTITKNVVDNLLKNSGIVPALIPVVQRNIVADTKLQTSFAEQVKCPVAEKVDVVACMKDITKCGATGEERNANRLAITLTDGCTAEGLTMATHNYIQVRNALTNADRENQLDRNQGFYSKVTCSNGSTASTQEECLVLQTYTVATPGIDIKDVHTDAQLSGARQQQNANEIGSLVNSLFAQLGQQSLTSLKGLVGLSQKSSTGSGSYLDNLSQNAQTSTTNQAKITLNSNIEKSLVTEYAYQATLADMIVNLENTKSGYASVQACYLALVTKGGGLGIDSATATTKMNQASSTVNTTLTPQIELASIAFDNSDSTSSSLEALQSEVGSAENSTEINALSEAFNSLKTYGPIHTQNNLASLTNDRDASKTLLAEMTATASTELTQCKNY